MLNRLRNRDPFFTPADREALGWFWHRYMKPKTPWLGIVFALIAVQGLVYQQFLRLTEDGLRIVFESGSMAQLAQVCAVVCGVFMVRGVVSYIVPRMSVWIASDAVMKMRTDMIAHLLKLDLAFFDKSTSGDVMLKLVQQAEGLSSFISQSTIKALRDVATVVVVSGYLFYKQPLLFTATLILLPLILLVLQLVSRGIKEIQKRAQAVLGTYMNSVEEMTNGMRTIKISGQEYMEEKRLHTTTNDIKDLAIRLQSAQAIVNPFVDIAAAIGYVMVIGGGGYMVLSPDFDIDGAEIIAFLIGLVLVFDPGRRLSAYFVTIQASLILLRSIRGVFFEKPTIVNKPNAANEFNALGDITLENVSFRYNDDLPILRSVDMTLQGGKVTSIVGPTGSGKTTILSLLGRLYEPETGQVSIGDLPIQDIDIASLRSAFSVVAQDIVIFNKSIFENIRYVRPEASDEEVWAAAEDAELKELMEERGGTPVGPKGAQLSGGQKQRIAIARAFLRNAPIVLLDEATSALDQRTEERVKTSLERLSRERTTIMVAHKLSSIIHSDCIYVLEAGAVIEHGTHEELMANGGLYQSMFESQQKSYAK